MSVACDLGVKRSSDVYDVAALEMEQCHLHCRCIFETRAEKRGFEYGSSEAQELTTAAATENGGKAETHFFKGRATFANDVVEVEELTTLLTENGGNVV
ncbi:hypothetical protein Nepgr_031165 [Nepenthes gracilis]|uniref:Uncharacterized protein n=1 Tax=Nepenthes gracilis TaxID=150966 RepID=A0AAD3Y4J8_NEPGR|nr:hypothetical protein Nepgr_031165 [Nepenthes gracilis]